MTRLLVVDGNPLDDIRLLQDHARIWLVLQGGRPVAGTSLAGDPRGEGAGTAAASLAHHGGT